MTVQVPDETAVDRPRSPARSILPWILLILVLVPLVTCGLFTVVTVGGTAKAVSIVREVLNGGELVVRSDRTPAIITQVRELGRLETASYTVEKVIEGGVDQGNDILNFFLGDRLLLIAHGEVVAGVDLTQLQDDDLRVTKNGAAVVLRLPQTAILSYRLDNTKTYVYDRRQGLLTKGDPNLESEVRRAAEQEILGAACQGEILAQATESAQRQLTTLLLSLDFGEVEFLDPAPGPTGCE